ncbi:uncharacterized protein LOC123319759 isoform X2 [Coccinella septempunctata]|uniref:uncharacterized protein LOC123319759 isoform X2 n=1 Tax=Coccinella septempunctata TaxID=41139 RepID=UPI001D08166E|nr:uncharacterized protein LOC123319759 isoform X2 [Coccinella septempunctata]
MQFMSVRIPSLLNYYVSLDENSLVIKSEEKRKITIKLLPSNDLMSEKCKYFDQDTSILYFPIEVRLTDKKYAPVPPTIEHCYAIVNDCSDLTLDPQREHYEMCDGQMVLDVGEISVIEAVTTKVVLRNSSYSKRYYGFLDLPRYISIMPNCGFGSINAFQEITLDVYFHPQVDDFRVATSNQDKYRQNRNVTIRVDTIANLGKYRRKPNMNRLLKLMKRMLEEMAITTNIDLLESIFAAKSDIRTEFDLCTCSSALLLKSPSKKLSLQEENEELNKNEDAADSDMKQQESITKIGHHHKKKKKMSTSDLSKQHSDEDTFSMKKSSSADSSMKRKRSRVKSISEPEITLTVEDRQPSLLEKKAIQRLSTGHTPVVPIVPLINLAETLSRELRFNMTFAKPLYEFSFNHLEFPVTPGGSYSMMMTELRPLKKSEKTGSCGIGAEGKKPKFRSTFRIAGSTQEMRVEPMCGVLEHGESIKLTVVATPKMSEDVVAAYALEQKKNALYQEKMEEELRKREDNLTHKKAKKSKTKVRGAKSKAKKEKSSIDIEMTKVTEEEIQIEISSKDVEVEYPDLYPAELAIWRSIEPYFLKTNFVCRIDYEMEEPWTHEPDIFSLATVCKVISPDFIHDQKVQRLDFGQVPIGDCKRKIVTIQNLRYHDITVTTNILRPEGGFFCPYFDSVKLPSECFLKIPITYTPTDNESVQFFLISDQYIIPPVTKVELLESGTGIMVPQKGLSYGAYTVTAVCSSCLYAEKYPKSIHQKIHPCMPW